MDPVARFLGGKTVRRLITVALFLGLLVVFRDLAPLLVFFLAFSRLLGAGTRFLRQQSRLPRKASVLVVVALFLAALGGASAIGVGRAIRGVVALRETLPAKIALVKDSPLYQTVHEQLQESDSYLESAKHYATSAVGYLTAFGHLFLNALIALILSVIFLLEEEELVHWYHAIEPRSTIGTLLRWFSYVAEAVVITLQLQLVVAACNAALTLPILIWLGVPHLGALLLLIFVSSLVPVVGNLVSGAALSLIAFHSRRWLGVGVFVVLTFVLHKIESYYLNPRLTSRHVRLPGFVLILSLIAWEHLLGIPGLFVSFPFLFVATRIRKELRDEDALPQATVGGA